MKKLFNNIKEWANPTETKEQKVYNTLFTLTIQAKVWADANEPGAEKGVLWILRSAIEHRIDELTPSIHVSKERMDEIILKNHKK
jgi:hypothetical protein